MSASFVFPVGNEFKENVNRSARKPNITSSAKKFGLQNSVTTRKPLSDKSNTVHTPTTSNQFKGVQKDSIKKTASKALGNNVRQNNWFKQHDYLLDTCSYDLDIEDTYPEFWSKWEKLSRKDIESIVRPKTPPMLEEDSGEILFMPVNRDEYYHNDYSLKPIIVDDVEFPCRL